MTYVMVPVPEEIAPEVRAYLDHNIGRRELLHDPNDVIADVYSQADDTGRSLLLAVARAIVGDEELSLDSTCRELGISHREIMGLVYEINFNVADAGGSLAALYAKPEPSTPPSTVPKWAHRVWVMDPEAALKITKA